ncbi:diaminopimelate decarboxylase [Candidatus Villigracilis affinis]|uniref:diaminopimelate decarboxylase n=1 Tax=Candidatus Villigracilis affinis TaxID=3140682 RepID=UPI002A218944|nr:diaminopimelate decarboxylase [Anaerolineales bacterium]
MNRLELFPISTTIEKDTLFIAGHDLEKLTGEHGTPLYLYDKVTMDEASTGYKTALASHYPEAGSVTYAGKAFLCTAIAQWAHGHGLYVDCTGEGEIAFALAGGVPREHILVHGVNKSIHDLKSAIQNAGTIVVDNLTELKQIRQLFTVSNSQFPDLWLRLLPGLAVETHHAHTQTGQHGSKFGMTGAEILEAAEFCKQHNLPLNGIHFHQGSNFRDANPLKAAISIGLDLAKEVGFSGEWHFSPGGGWGVAYHEDELPQPNTDEYVRVIAENVIAGCQARGLALPHLHLEPGRSLVARAGVAVYRVGAVKRRGEKVWILTDGGMTDNPRHAMYGARYSCLPVSGVGGERSEVVSIAGPFCESGDVVIEDLPMPKIHEGGLIAIPASGAYQLSMSSNYNGSRRPAVLWLEKGTARVIQRRETIQDLLARDEGI